jgi:hypothetical protein
MKTQGQTQSRNSSLRTIQRLLNSVAEFRQAFRHSQAENAPNFNLFRILGVEEDEVATHSAFLAHLLNPNETHAQGDLFLRRFLFEIGHEPLASFDGWIVSKEVPFVGGRLDIVLQSAKANAIIAIENKIGTEDQPDQLDIYRRWLDAPLRKTSFNTRLLLYLTPRGGLAKHPPKGSYNPISYSGHITRWLSSCTAKAPSVSDSIQTYLRTIGNLTTQTLMKDDLDDYILNLIKTPTERSAALRIARVSNLLKQEILQEFWDRGEAYLTRKLAEEKLTYWSLDRTEDSPLETHYEIGIVGKGVNKDRPHARFVFFQYNTATLFRWEWTVMFDYSGKKEKIIQAMPEARKLAAVMDGRLSMPRKHGWDGYLLFTEDLKAIERTLEEELSKSTDVSEFFDSGWQKFRELEPYLRRLNNAVVRM